MKDQFSHDLANLANGLTRIGELFDALNAAVEAQIPETVRSGNLINLLTLFRTLDVEYDKIDELRKKLYAAVDGLNKSAVPQAIEASGMDLVRVPTLARSFYPIDKLSVSIVPDKKSEAFDWLRGNGGADLPQLTVNAGTLAAWVRQKQKEDNVDPPPELFTLNAYKVTGSSKYNPK